MIFSRSSFVHSDIKYFYFYSLMATSSRPYTLHRGGNPPLDDPSTSYFNHPQGNTGHELCD